jgi:hypothetical protein
MKEIILIARRKERAQPIFRCPLAQNRGSKVIACFKVAARSSSCIKTKNTVCELRETASSFDQTIFINLASQSVTSTHASQRKLI